MENTKMAQQSKILLSKTAPVARYNFATPNKTLAYSPELLALQLVRKFPT